MVEQTAGRMDVNGVYFWSVLEDVDIVVLSLLVHLCQIGKEGA